MNQTCSEPIARSEAGGVTGSRWGSDGRLPAALSGALACYSFREAGYVIEGVGEMLVPALWRCARRTNWRRDCRAGVACTTTHLLLDHQMLSFDASTSSPASLTGLLTSNRPTFVLPNLALSRPPLVLPAGVCLRAAC